MSRLIHARFSENGDSGWNGKAKPGDQTGNEVSITDFYIKPWGVNIRYFNPQVSKLVVEIAKKLANCGLVGYDQSGRNTLYQMLKKYNFNVDAYISSGKLCETDCSEFIYACWCCVIPDMRSDANAPTTSTMRNFYKNHGFIIYTDTEHLTDSGKLLDGDILVSEGEHTVMTCDCGVGEIPIINPAVENALQVIARDVIAGNWGNGPDRKEKLYKEVQKRVNDMLK